MLWTCYLNTSCAFNLYCLQFLDHSLKEEEVHLNAYEDIYEARARIGHFITQVYHHKRPHSALGYLMPMEFQQQILS